MVLIVVVTACETEKPKKLTLKTAIYETSESGNKLTQLTEFNTPKDTLTVVSEIILSPEKQYQTITGFGGSFTESSAYLLNKLSQENRDKIIQAYFGNDGARYSLTRTHISSCDFSLSNYTYAPVADDMTLENFSIKEDQDDLIPMIKDAMKASEDGF